MSDIEEFAGRKHGTHSIRIVILVPSPEFETSFVLEAEL
jgi:hypothetical protein